MSNDGRFTYHCNKCNKTIEWKMPPGIDSFDHECRPDTSITARQFKNTFECHDCGDKEDFKRWDHAKEYEANHECNKKPSSTITRITNHHSTFRCHNCGDQRAFITYGAAQIHQDKHECESNLPENHGKPWSRMDKIKLAYLYVLSHSSIVELMRKFKRTKVSIESQLVRLHLMEYDSHDGYKRINI